MINSPFQDNYSANFSYLKKAEIDYSFDDVIFVVGKKNEKHYLEKSAVA